jgi:hypothetical protein
MIPALLLPLLLAGDPAVHLWINHDGRFVAGDYARIQVWTEDPGYLLVLHADPSGQLRVLFPLSPGDNNYVQGGERYELRDREGREGFLIEGSSGQGMVYAAVSTSPFEFDQFRQIDSWDHQALQPSPPPPGPESELTELVQQMARSDFDHDVVSYEVIERVVYASDDGADTSHTVGSGDFFGAGFGSPFFLGCSPFFFNPCFPFQPCFQCSSFFDPFLREPALITRFAPRRFVPGSGDVASARERSNRGLSRQGWPVDVSPRSSQLVAMARQASWPMDVSRRHSSPDPTIGLRGMGDRGGGLRPRMNPERPPDTPRFGDRTGLEMVPSPGLRSLTPPNVPSLHGGLGLRPR